MRETSSEELALELEALHFTYGEQLEVVLDGDSAAHLALRLVPRATEHEAERFVAATVRLGVPAGYPADALPSAELVEVKGELVEQAGSGCAGGRAGAHSGVQGR